MITLLTVVHILVALVLILVVLLQSARGTDLAGAFGGMGSQTAFGPRGTTTFLSKTTAGLAAAFMVTSLLLAILSNRTIRSGSVLSGEKSAPVKPQSQSPTLPGGISVPQIPGLPPGVKQDVKIIPPSPAGANTAPSKPPAEAPAAPAAGGSQEGKTPPLAAPAGK